MGASSALHDNLFQGKGPHRPRTVAIQPELGETSTITTSVPVEVVLTAGEMK